MTYRPLPEGLIVSKSNIEGMGLFTTQHIPENTVLGIIHIHDTRFENNCIRTPLGGFINHSSDPNLEAFLEKDLKYIKSIREIAPSEELTLKYTLYKL